MYAVYRLAPIGVGGAMEAETVEHWACNEAHARKLAASMTEPSAIERNTDALEGTACDVCGRAKAPPLRELRAWLALLVRVVRAADRA